jgi:hypothetical protein
LSGKSNRPLSSSRSGLEFYHTKYRVGKYRGKGGRRQEAGGRRQEAGGRRQEAVNICYTIFATTNKGGSRWNI